MGQKIPCVFCGSVTAPTSDEHVLPQHWKKHFPKESGTGLRVSTAQGITDRPPRKHITPFDMKVPNVCAPCNNGWMRLMDEAMKPLVFDLANGVRRTLSSTEVDSLIQWVTKVALVRSYADRKSSMTFADNVFRRYYAQRTETHHRSTQIAWCDEHDGALSASTTLIRTGRPRGPLESSEREPANVISLKLGHLLIQCGLSTGSKWSTSSVRLMMTSSRQFVPGRLFPAVAGRPFRLPEQPLTEDEVDLVIEPLHLMGAAKYVGSPVPPDTTRLMGPLALHMPRVPNPPA